MTFTLYRESSFYVVILTLEFMYGSPSVVFLHEEDPHEPNSRVSIKNIPGLFKTAFYLLANLNYNISKKGEIT